MRERRVTASIAGHRLVMNMIQERPTLALGWETEEVNVEVYTSAIAVGGPGDVAADCGGVTVGENSSIGHAGGVVVDDRGGAGECESEGKGRGEDGDGGAHDYQVRVFKFWKLMVTGALANCGEDVGELD